MLNRRTFLSAIAAIPILGRLVPKPAEQNPVRVIADYMRAAGFTVDQASVDAAAACCEAPVPLPPETALKTYMQPAVVEIAKRIEQDVLGMYDRSLLASYKGEIVRIDPSRVQGASRPLH